jgi:hypothetical protein
MAITFQTRRKTVPLHYRPAFSDPGVSALGGQPTARTPGVASASQAPEHPEPGDVHLRRTGGLSYG